jgi:alkaline phosphatase D
MRRLAVVALALAACVAVRFATDATSASVGFSYGVAAGEVTSTSAVLWTRAPKPGRVTFEVRTTNPAGSAVVGSAVANAQDDLTVRVHLMRKLLPGVSYRYRFRQGSVVSPTGAFVTAPTVRANATVRFAFTGDADATPGGNGKPAFNAFQVYGRMAAELNDFNINLGDTIYSDSELAGAKPAVTVAERWEKYKLGLALPDLRRLRAVTGLYSHWDDHEFVNDFSVVERGEAVYRAGVEAFTDYAPVTYTARNGLYRTFRWGKNLELFFLDERSFRSAKASAGHACDVGGAPDLAPTAPPATRAAFATLIPSFRQPVPAGCLTAIDDPARTMLGERQHTTFIRAIRASTARWKVVVNETPIQQLYQLPYDRWEGYAAERSQLLADLAGTKNVVFLTTDLHANAIGEVRTRTLEAGGPVATGIWEIVTGPVATNTYTREIDTALGRPGAGVLVTSLFLKPRPPVGIGLRCAATNVYSYAEVVVTARTLTVTPTDAAGMAVREPTGGGCARLVLRAR